MAVGNYTIEWSTDYTTWTMLSDVQTINARIGRTAFIDTFQPSSMSFSMRYPNGFYSPNTALVTGTWVRLKRTGALYTMWTGKISNVVVEWGNTYNTTTHVGNMDFVTVNCEGAFAEWGRLDGNDEAITEANAYYALAQVASASGLSLGTTYDAANSPLVSASTVSSSYADWINTFATTLSATVKDGGGNLGVYTKDFIGTLPVSFSDTTNDGTHQVYEQIQLTSQVENYFTEILVDTELYGQARAYTGAGPYRTLRLSTFSGTLGQAQDLAEYYLAIYQTPIVGISQITCRSESQNTWALDLGYSWYDILGYRTDLTFRGTTYYMSILGSSFQATPEGSTFSYDLASAAFLPFFILDSPTYGILDTNRLSW
jgi:hypothetical protein